MNFFSKFETLSRSSFTSTWGSCFCLDGFGSVGGGVFLTGFGGVGGGTDFHFNHVIIRLEFCYEFIEYIEYIIHCVYCTFPLFHFYVYMIIKPVTSEYFIKLLIFFIVVQKYKNTAQLCFYFITRYDPTEQTTKKLHYGYSNRSRRIERIERKIFW